MNELLKAITLECQYQRRAFPYWGYSRKRYAEAFSVGALPV